MGFLKDPHAFICVLQTVLKITNYRFILFTAGYEPLESVVRMLAAEVSSDQRHLSEDCVSLFSGRLFTFSGFVFSFFCYKQKGRLEENWGVQGGEWGINANQNKIKE